MTTLGIAVTPGDQIQPKIAPAADGGAYISWFGNAGGGYDVWLQRIDAAGNPLWGPPLLVADRSFSSTQDYGLSIDTEGHALLAFRDDRFTGIQITATRIAPDGAMVWGPNGVQLTDGDAFVASPKIAGAADDAIVVGWTQDSNTHLAKLSLLGGIIWGEHVITDATGSASFSMSDLQSSDAPDDPPGSVIALVVRQSGSTRHLYARSIAPGGGDNWTAPLFTTGSLQFGNFPTCVPDRTGGLVTSWYTIFPLQCYAQWIDGTGTVRWTAGGVPVSTNARQRRVSPSLAFNTITNEAFVFWTETDALQNQQGLYGQRLSEGGTRLWSDDGVELLPLSATPVTQVRAMIHQATEPGAAVFFAEGAAPNPQFIRGARLDDDGGHVWSPPFIDVSTAPSSKSRLAVARSADGFAILAWSDDRNDSGDIYAQNVNPDGTLGLPSPPADLNGDGAVNAADLALLLGAWGACPGCAADLNGDGTVNAADLALLLGSWG